MRLQHENTTRSIYLSSPNLSQYSNGLAVPLGARWPFFVSQPQPLGGDEPVNTVQPSEPQPLEFIGVKMAPALADALRQTAAARGVTLSAVMRDALAKELAGVPNPGPQRRQTARNSQN